MSTDTPILPPDAREAARRAAPWLAAMRATLLARIAAEKWAPTVSPQAVGGVAGVPRAVALAAGL